MTTISTSSSGTLVATGVPGLDDVLRGGLTARRLFLVEGTPGSGKTTLALQFLLEGLARGERVMYVTLSETAEELRATAAGHGWDISGLELVELTTFEEGRSGESQYTMYHPSEVELSETTRSVMQRVDALRPERLVFDSLSELRLLSQNPLRFRRQILILKQYFSRRDCTVLLADDRSAEDGDPDLFSIAHGVISLERHATEYGSLRRQLHVVKMRGRPFREGWHDMRLTTGGITVYPRLISAEHRAEFTAEPVSSGLPNLDRLMGGGPTRGTSMLLVGPAGVGKSSIAAQYAHAACMRGEHAAVFLFEELFETFLTRCEGLNIDLRGPIAAGNLLVRQVDPAELAPGEFAQAVRDAVEIGGAQVVIIDTLNGYLNAMPSERMLLVHMHELLSYLGQKGVLTILVTAQHGLVGTHMGSPVDTSYLADSVLLLRYYEAEGYLQQAISVVKMRTGLHDRAVCRLSLSGDGIRVGEPLNQYRGILTGVPELERSTRADAGASS